MLIRPFVFALVAALAPVGAGMPPAFAQTASEVMTIDELMHVTALDEVFTQFGPTVETSPEQQGAPFTGAMSAAWTVAAREAFDAETMHADLAAALEGRFTPADLAAFDAFFRSAFGVRVTGIERTVTLLPPEAQAQAREEGIALTSEDDARRHAQIDEMLRLISAEIATAMVRQSVRSLLIGMSITSQQGDIEVPWEEIDAHIEAIMPEIEADVELTQRAIMFYAYRDLSEAELERYLAFLRTEPAQKFYALAAYSIGQIVADRMELFGETLALRLARVGV